VLKPAAFAAFGLAAVTTAPAVALALVLTGATALAADHYR